MKNLKNYLINEALINKDTKTKRSTYTSQTERNQTQHPILTRGYNKKFNYKKDICEFPSWEFKTPRKYTKKLDFSTRYFPDDWLEKYFGWINQWIDKALPAIVKQVTDEVVHDPNVDFPDSIQINLPKNLYGTLYFDLDIYWTDGIPHGYLRGAEISVSQFCPGYISNYDYYKMKQDLENFELFQKITF